MIHWKEPGLGTILVKAKLIVAASVGLKYLIFFKKFVICIIAPLIYPESELTDRWIQNLLLPAISVNKSYGYVESILVSECMIFTKVVF